MTQPSVLIGIPLERNVNAIAFCHLVDILRKGYPYIKAGYRLTPVQRNTFASELLKTEHTHLLMLDTDHQHPSDIAERLLRWWKADNSRKIIAALCFRRGEPYDPLAFVKTESGEFHTLAQWPKTLVQVQAVGSGAILIHRSVFEQLKFPWFEITYVNGVAIGEDMTFCRKAEEAGISIWCDMTTVSPHIMESLVDEGSFRNWLANNEGKAKKVSSVKAQVAKVKED